MVALLNLAEDTGRMEPQTKPIIQHIRQIRKGRRKFVEEMTIRRKHPETQNFHIKVFARKTSKFEIWRSNGLWRQLDILPDDDDNLSNFTHGPYQLLRLNREPWRGACEKHTDFIQCFIECLTDKKDIVFDSSASTGF